MGDSLCEKAGLKIKTDQAEWTTNKGNLTVEPQFFSIEDGLRPAGFKVAVPVSLFEGAGFVELNVNHFMGRITPIKDLPWPRLFGKGENGTADFYFLSKEAINKINPREARNVQPLSPGFEKGTVEITFSNITVEKSVDGKGFQPVKKDGVKLTGKYELASG